MIRTVFLVPLPKLMNPFLLSNNYIIILITYLWNYYDICQKNKNLEKAKLSPNNNLSSVKLIEKNTPSITDYNSEKTIFTSDKLI